MTGPKGNNEFCCPETLNVPEAKPRETLRSRRNKTHCFLQDQSLSVLLYLPTQNLKKLWRNCLLYAGWLANLMQFQGPRPDRVQVESSCCCFPRELVSFVRPWELSVLTHSTWCVLQSENALKLGGITILVNSFL